MEIYDASGVFDALAHPTRLGVLRLLIPAGRDGLAAGDIGRRLDLAPNSLSFHLGRLAQAGLIVSRRHGRNLFYAADYVRLDDLLRYLADDCCADAPEGCFPDCPASTPRSSVGCATALPGADRPNPRQRE